MEILKMMIANAEMQKKNIEHKKGLINELNKRCIQVSASGYYVCDFTDDRKQKVKDLIESFIAEDEQTLKPLIDKLNLISDLVKG